MKKPEQPPRSSLRWYLVPTIVVTSITLAALFGLVLLLFHRDIDRQRKATTERMRAIARYAGSLALDTPDGEVEEALAALCDGAGCERIVITDELGLVWWSGHPLIGQGDDIAPYLVDETAFRRGLADTTVRFTETVRIGGSWFQSMYYPLITDSRMYMVVVEADREYLAAAERFRNNITMLGVAAGVLQGVLLVSLLMIARRARDTAERARANEHLAFLGRAGAELTHELKNPLAIIKSSVDVLRRTHDPDRSARPFAFISEEIMRLSRLIDTILSFSREKSLRAESFAAAPLLAEALSRIVHGETVRFTCRVPATLMLVGDRDAFVRIIDNLLRNAVQAAGERPVVLSIEFAREKDAALLYIDDTGPGIPEPVRRTPFAPFVSGRADGTGLGLAIVKSLCDRMGWSVSLARTGPAGTRFTLTVPGALWHESS
jgi:signal transduction histidine kinase